MLIDAHCHITFLSEEEKKRIFSSYGTSHIFIDSSINYQSTLASSKISSDYPFIYSALGFHPFYVRGFTPHILKSYREIIDKNKKIIAIGEIGLDDKAEAKLDEQENIFRIFLKLAKETNLPLIIHNRLHSRMLLGILDDFFNSYEKIVFHCFSYPADFLKKIIEKKGYISFSLNILRKKKDITESLKECPLENLLLETDSPYMRIGDRASTPLDIKEVYAYVTSLKGIEQKKLEEIVFSNVKKVFGLLRE
ncbi:MAG: TatD family hydrolase [Candidatus Omnitrophota bacterium]|nr:TatD family hydrolase [Candidatus Omnitrophota bacterium]